MRRISPGWNSSIRCVRPTDSGKAGIENGVIPLARHAEPAIDKCAKLWISEADLEGVETVDDLPHEIGYCRIKDARQHSRIKRAL